MSQFNWSKMLICCIHPLIVCLFPNIGSAAAGLPNRRNNRQTDTPVKNHLSVSKLFWHKQAEDRDGTEEAAADLL